METPPSILRQLLPLAPIALAVLVWGYFMLRRARRQPPIDLQGSAVAPVTSLASGQIRRRGLTMMGVGAGVLAAVLFLIYWLPAHGYSFHFAIIPAAFPFVLICVGFVETVTGAPYRRLAQKWMGLAGWQRGLLGTFLVITALAVIVCAVTFFVMMFT